MLDEQLAAALARRDALGTRRRLLLHDAATATTLAGLADFSSNDYLSMARDADVHAAWVARLSPDVPLGSGGSRLLDGDSTLHTGLEARLASYFGTPAALLFNSGYDANVSLLTTLPQRGDVVVYDELVHASMHDGMRASRARACVPFRHNDAQDLDRVLGTLPASGNVFLALESVYSMDGTVCALRAMADVLARHVPDARARYILLDEAHGVGVYGRGGRGVAHALGADAALTTRLITFGKAWGCAGAAVLCSELVKEYLVNYARPLVYSTALAPVQVLAIQTVLERAESGDMDRRQAALRVRVDRLLAALGRAPPPPDALAAAPIVPVRHAAPRALAAHLQRAGFLVRPVCYPTVPRNEERVRICVHAHNTLDDIDALAQAVRSFAQATL